MAGLILYDTSLTSGPEFWADVVQNVARYVERLTCQPEVAEILHPFQQWETADDETFTASFRACCRAISATSGPRSAS